MNIEEYNIKHGDISQLEVSEECRQVLRALSKEQRAHIDTANCDWYLGTNYTDYDLEPFFKLIGIETAQIYIEKSYCREQLILEKRRLDSFLGWREAAVFCSEAFMHIKNTVSGLPIVTLDNGQHEIKIHFSKYRLNPALVIYLLILPIALISLPISWTKRRWFKK